MAEPRAYVTVAEPKAQGVDSLSASSADALALLIKAASRMFDRAAEVPAGYFAEAESYGTWAAAHAYALDEVVKVGTHYYRVTTAGTSGALAPTWLTTEGALVTDGTATWTEIGTTLATERIFYGADTDYLRLWPYVPGSIPEDGGVVLPDDVPETSFIEITDGEQFTLQRAYSSAVSTPLSLLVPAHWTRPGYYAGDHFQRYAHGWAAGLAVTVTARWGWEATPADVKQSVIQIALKLLRGPDPAFARAADLEQAVAREDLPPVAKMVAEKWAMRGLQFGL